MDRVALDRKLSGRTLALTLMLCWPLLMFGRPAYFPDTLGYYHGGQTAAAFFVRHFQPPAASRAEAGPSGDEHDTRAARSIPYSVLAFALRGADDSMTPLAVLQAFLTAFAVTVFLCAAPVSDRGYWITAALLALATPAAWVSSYAMPDIFAGVTILAIATLSFRARRLTTPVAVLLSLTGALAIASHASHIAIAMLVAPLGLWWGGSLRGLRDRMAMLWLAAPALIGIAAVVAAGVVGFGEVSVAPKRYPLTLARFVGDGPGRWYLERHCATERFAVCEIYGDKLPETSNDFLWGPNGVNRRATPAQMARLRAEEGEILLRTFAAYPLAEATAALRGVGRQVINFRIDEADFNQRIDRTEDGTVTFAEDPKLPATARRFADGVYAAFAALALGWLVLGFLAAPRDRRAIVGVLLAGLLANAAVCAILSGVSDRYQARVIWLLPLAAALTPAPLGRRRITGRPPALA